jgi:hypothetical protein
MLENKPGCEWRSKESVASSSWRVETDGGVGLVAHADATTGRAAAMRKLRRLGVLFSCRASAAAKSRDHESKQLGLHMPRLHRLFRRESSRPERGAGHRERVASEKSETP